MRDPRRRFTDAQARQIAERSGGKCWKCKATLEPGYHVHHLIPWAKGGLTEVGNGIALCEPCHEWWHQKGERMSTGRIVLRDWQTKCRQVIRDNITAALSVGAKPVNRIGACVGAGKSTMMASIAYDLTFGDLAEICPVDFNVFVAPNRAIIGAYGGSGGNSEAFGIIGALMRHGIWPMERITVDRMAGLSVCPELGTSDSGIVTGAAAVFTYQYLSQRRVQETLIRWAESGLRIAIHYDEIHHVPYAGTVWAEALDRINAVAACINYWSGTWYRTDQLAIKGRSDEDSPELTFCYPYADGIRDGIVRPVSFWIPDTTAKTYDEVSGTLIDERPVSEYLEFIPPHVRKEMFDPNGWFVETMIRRANQELVARRRKYPDAGCLVVCPPGFHEEDDAEGAAEQDRIAERIHRRVVELTGKRAALILNGHPASKIAEYRESNDEFVVAVNRISEGCDIPRLRLALILRDLSGSELLFEQIIGRIIRRRKEDDEEPALAIIPPIHAMCEFARRVTIAEKGVVPKKADICSQCERIPCRCPCRSCGQPRPCKCPCRKCGQKPCICEDVPLDVFARLEGIRDGHIAQGTDIEDPYAIRADAIRSRVDAFRHRDLAAIALTLQCDAEVNGNTSTTTVAEPVPVAPQVVANAQNWVNLRNLVPVKVKKFARLFRDQGKEAYKAAWNCLSRRCFPGLRWKSICDDPTKLSFEKLKQIHAYLDRATKGGQP